MSRRVNAVMTSSREHASLRCISCRQR
jgi:hypothetical protein